MIINFSITNFGSIKNTQTLSFEAENTDHLQDYYIIKTSKYRLLKLALIYGANASGKTTILNALDFLRQLVLNPADKKTKKLNFQPFLFDEYSRQQDSILSLEFLQNDIKYFYLVKFNKNAIVEEALYVHNPNKANVFKRTTDLKNKITKIKFGSKITIPKTELKVLETNTLWNNTVLGGYLKTNIQIKELQEVINWFDKTLKPVIYPQTKLDLFISSLIQENEIKKEHIVTILKKADLNISDILIKKEEAEIPDEFINLLENSNFPQEELEKLKSNKKVFDIKLDFEHSVAGKKYSLPFEIESAGTKRFYGFAGILNLLIKKSVIFPIDELGASIHPDLYQYFLLCFLANSKKSQLIATTHNREILNDRDLIRDDSLWITDKKESVATELYSFSDFDSSIIRDTTNRLNAYKSGKLGGIPNLSDYFLTFE